MNPKEFNWQADDQVTVVNPTDETFRFQVHSKLYEVAAGQKARMPGYIAWLYCYKMAQQLITADGQLQHWNDEGFRNKYYNRLVQGTENTIQAIQDEPEPEAETFEPEPDEIADESQESVVTGIKPMQSKRKVVNKTK